MRNIFSIFAVMAAFVLAGCPGNSKWRSSAPTGNYNEIITVAGQYSFKNYKIEFEIFKDKNGLLNYCITQPIIPVSKEMEELLPNGRGGVSARTDGFIAPNAKWFFVITENPFRVWSFDGVEKIGIIEVRNNGTVLSDFESSSAELKKQIPAKFFETLPEVVREKIKTGGAVGAEKSTAPAGGDQ